jgi:acyl-CoA synthetase (AMP-forming)/AMP-acid ligase II
VQAVIILRDGMSLSPDELLDWCKNRIAGYKRPRSVSIIRENEMPRTATGKILHRQLRAKYAITAD